MKTITIEIRGGVVIDVRGLPFGWDYELQDHDNPDCPDCLEEERASTETV